MELKPNPGLYFVAFLFAEEVNAPIQQIKQDLGEITGSKHSLSILPHITVLPPAKWTSAELPLLVEMLHQHSKSLTDFEVMISSFSAFREDVLFLKPEMPESIYQWQQNLELECREIFPEKFRIPLRQWHPHVTLAFKDLTPENFHVGRKWLQEKQVNLSATIYSVSLLEHKETWKPVMNFHFKDPHTKSHL